MWVTGLRQSFDLKRGCVYLDGYHEIVDCMQTSYSCSVSVTL